MAKNVISVTAGSSKTAKLPRYTVKVLASNGKWRAAYETSLQACFALVDGLACDFRIVADNEILLSQSGGSLVTLAKLCGKPLRDYRYLQGKKIAKQLPTICELHIKLVLDLQQFPRRASTVQAPAVLPAIKFVERFDVEELAKQRAELYETLQRKTGWKVVTIQPPQSFPAAIPLQAPEELPVSGWYRVLQSAY